LKRGKLVISVKGAQGGYQLARSPSLISAYDVLLAVESSLFEGPEDTVRESDPELEGAMRDLAFFPLDAAIKKCLSSVAIDSIYREAELRRSGRSPMYYI
ncbi:MAG: Rrf2 family transcriptional regulator, partial [Eubacteriaceae bacterium]|nr:Rrf2 family transcriptional regulator [Eubacteriaceae bacterium]